MPVPEITGRRPIFATAISSLGLADICRRCRAPKTLDRRRPRPSQRTDPVLIGWSDDEGEPQFEPLSVGGRAAILLSWLRDGNRSLIVSLGDEYHLDFAPSREDLIAQADVRTLGGGRSRWSETKIQ